MALERLISAPIDEKNVTSDWIYEMFDMGDCVEDNGTYVGVINHAPAFCRITDNMADFMLPRSPFYTQEQMDAGFARLAGRLERFIDDISKQGDLCVKYYKDSHLWRYVLYFYFEEKHDTNLF